MIAVVMCQLLSRGAYKHHTNNTSRTKPGIRQRESRLHAMLDTVEAGTKQARHETSRTKVDRTARQRPEGNVPLRHQEPLAYGSSQWTYPVKRGHDDLQLDHVALVVAFEHWVDAVLPSEHVGTLSLGLRYQKEPEFKGNATKCGRKRAFFCPFLGSENVPFANDKCCPRELNISRFKQP